MPNDRDEREESRFKIIDNRMLSDDERSGKIITSSTPQNEEQPTPKLEVIGGGQSHLGASSLHEEPGEAVSAPSAFGDAADATETVAAGYEVAEDESPLSLEKRSKCASKSSRNSSPRSNSSLGRALTDNEKEQVRALMDKQAESMTNLEVAPILMQTVSEIPRFAAVHLGLVPNPYTGIITRNDAEARLAIDAFGALYEVLKTRLDARTSGELARVLNDLRVNYTRITGIAFTPSGGLGGPRIIR
jgi:hypothetical protein